MGFVDVFYYGQCRLICTSTTSADNGKTVSVTSASGRSWSGTLANLKCEFTLPPKDVYTVSLIDSGVTQYTTKVIAGYGDCIELPVGMDSTTPLGIKAIVNAGLESEFFEVGDQIMFKEGADLVAYDVLHVDYKIATYGHNVLFQRHNCLDTSRGVNASNTNVGGFESSALAAWLDGEFFNGLDANLKSVITQMTFQASIGSQSTNLQNEEHKIWLPLEFNIFGAITHSAATERTGGNAEQFAYYATAANRVKTMNGAASGWWECSPYVGDAASFCYVGAPGTTDYASASATNAKGVAPCFMIAADN